ncbi:GAS8-like protein, putative [Plasmodium knowlesi strain H]|uniref:GAS8-like protein, putative n=3 Tax=Plasmodium knowlesi TaxID=5850 RepID=A0A1A7W6G1_PLAKH|nr:GAS8-like protein, putative [Plasmodium knowlesi strain H]OTN63717.1 putative GAS8-like protein [Plasmodium knowlesi]CAA9991214.1 GAS8-like protein, putative [Plasmodium knowlesi strain H]SBO26278.1 GAS8-like protein, putative [Plasmodium knowlesi strain H]SBO29585.1 GAS8-like protein, putative [Plasmodium knowlesi strain H]VVS80688.1 GAS8-like protein, putative [Plasmodium knowlesi strain H]
MNKSKSKSKKKKGIKGKDNETKNLSNEEIENLVKIQREELLRAVQRKRLLESRLEEKKNELERFKKEYHELKSKVDFLSEGCEKYGEKTEEEPKVIKNKSVFYNFQNAEELKKLNKEKEDIKTMIGEKHEQTMNNLVNFIDQQRVNLDDVKNRNFEEIDHLNASFDLKLKKMEKLFKTYLEEYEHDMKDEMDEMIDNYNVIERNEIIYLNNLYNDHINSINEIHVDMLQNCKNYYIEQIRGNIDKIKSLKSNINELDERDRELRNNLSVHSSQNLDMAEKIGSLEVKRENLNKDLKFYSKDFVIFKNLELIYNESNMYIKNLREFAQNSKEKISQVEEAFEELPQGDDQNGDAYFEGHFEEIENKNRLLRKMVQNIDLDMDAVNKELTSYINSHHVRDNDVQKVRQGINFCMQTYNKEFDNLLYTKKRVKKKMKDTSNVYEKKLRDINVKQGG